MKLDVQIKSTEYDAKGIYSIENQSILVLKGSKFRLSYVDSLKKHPYFSKREVFFSSGKLNSEGILIEDYKFDNPSLAASLIQGRSSNGKKDWKLEDGTSLDENLNKDVTLETDEKKLEYVIEFLKDIDILDEVNDKLGFNVFKTLNIVHNEIRHSNVISWLINPNETHQLKDLFFKNLVIKIYLDNQKRFKASDLEQLFIWDFNDLTVYREKNHIDILVVDDKNKLVFAIENKIRSTEHSNQLERYKVGLEKNYPLNTYNHMYVYLTANEDDASDSSWISFSYKDLVEVIEKMIPNLNDKPLHFINDYIAILRREIMPNEKLEKLCADIYKKHKYALDLIYQYKPDEISNISDTIIKMIDENNMYTRYHSVKNYIRFSTQSLNQLNKKYKDVAGNWVKEQAVILYEIKINNKMISLSIVVGPTKDNSRNVIIDYYKNKTNESLKESVKWTTLRSVNLISIKSMEEMESIIDKVEGNFNDNVSKFVLEIDKIFENFNSDMLKVMIND